MATVLSSRGFKRLLLTETKVYLRGSDMFWALLFPTVLLVGQAAIAPELRQLNRGDTWAGTPFYGVTLIAVLLPAILAMSMAMTAVSIMPAHFGGFREKGILRRFSATPMRPQALFAAHYIINVVMALIGGLLAIAVISALFTVPMPDNILMVVLGFVLGMVALMSIGSLIAAWVPKASTGTLLGNLVFFPLIFTAGVFTIIQPDTWLYEVARLSPLGAASQVMSYGWFGGQTFPWIQITAMLVWTAVLMPLAVKIFKWS